MFLQEITYTHVEVWIGGVCGGTLAEYKVGTIYWYHIVWVNSSPESTLSFGAIHFWQPGFVEGGGPDPGGGGGNQDDCFGQITDLCSRGLSQQWHLMVAWRWKWRAVDWRKVATSSSSGQRCCLTWPWRVWDSWAGWLCKGYGKTRVFLKEWWSRSQLWCSRSQGWCSRSQGWWSRNQGWWRSRGKGWGSRRRFNGRRWRWLGGRWSRIRKPGKGVKET